MNFFETTISGAFEIKLETLEDERGYFARTWAKQLFHDRGLDTNLSECSISYNRIRGTLRGLHYQVAPNEEAKLVSCVSGRIFDVIVDLRCDSQTYLKTYSTELSLEDQNQLYIPAGVAHGFFTLQDDSFVLYNIAGTHAPAAARGIRWNDPKLNVVWPGQPRIISERDQNYADYAA